MLLSEILVYLNPATNTIHTTTKVNLSSLAFYDVFGKLILRKQKDTNTIAVSNLASGIYFLELSSRNEKGLKKVLVN